MNRLQADLSDNEVDVLLINIHEPLGRELATRFGFRATPTYILFDDTGTETWRGNFPLTEADLLGRVD